MIILGIDPGTATTGFGVIKLKDKKPSFVDCGIISTDKNNPMPQRLAVLHKDLVGLVKSYKVNYMVVEQLFFARNVTTAITVGQARGVILLVAAKFNLGFSEYTPLQIKQSTTGYGQASKKQVQIMVKTILSLNDLPKPDDAADGLAVALTHCVALNNNKLIS